MGLPGGQTLPALLLEHARIRPNMPAFREKHLGIWQTWNWLETNSEVRALACGLADQGFRRGMNLAIIGDNRPSLYWAMAAVQCLGGIPVPLYQDAPAADMAYVLENADIHFVIVEDQEQVDKVLELKSLYPGIRHVTFDDTRGMRHYHQPELISYQSLQELGRRFDAAHPEFFMREVNACQADDIAIMLYTSGTTGKPKGVCQTHAALTGRARVVAEMEALNETDVVLSYLPMAWVGDNVISYVQALVVGFTVNCPESSETVMTDLREIGPTYYFAPPRVFENILTSVMLRMEDASPTKRRMFDYFMQVAKQVGSRLLDGKQVNWSYRFLYWLGDLSIYAPLRNVMGLSRIRIAYTAGEAIGPDLLTFYRSLGVNLKQLYGSTETCAFVCIQPNGMVRPDSVGLPIPGVELMISDEGEVLVKSPGLFKQYYRNPEETRAAFTESGWFRTGDAGYFDADGHLKIIDRARDVGKLSNGHLFAPKYVENKLKFSTYIKEAVVFGNRRSYCTAIINIDSEATGNWAERRGIAYSGYTDLAAHPDVYELIAACIAQTNQTLSEDATLTHLQIHRMLILHKQFDPDDEELTRTRKIRREFVENKYEQLITAMFSDKTSQYIETQVKFEDGRQSLVCADIKIADLKVFAATGETR